MGDEHTLPPGTLVAGKLRVIRQLGAGGMGAVYEVEHELTRHHRALKLLHPRMLAHPMVVARFLREASAAGHIGNPHVVETFDAGTLETGEPYIVMEMLEGETLSAMLQRPGGVDSATLVDWMLQVCEGVHAAHEKGIVHRDLKPDNIFVTRPRGTDGTPVVKVLDFGISKFDRSLTADSGSTNEGSVMGTPYYMSWEQLNGDKDIDRRTDVYSLGIILYECIGGRRPYEAAALAQLAILAHESNPTPLSDLAPNIPPRLAEVVRKAMARDRDERFATAADLAAALLPFATSALESTFPDAPKPPPAASRAATPATTPVAVVEGKAVASPPMATRSRLVAGAVVLLVVAAGVASVVHATAADPRGVVAPAPSDVTGQTPTATATTQPSAPVTLVPSATVTVRVTTSAAPSHAAPTATATPSSRAAQQGLAGNPFE